MTTIMSSSNRVNVSSVILLAACWAMMASTTHSASSNHVLLDAAGNWNLPRLPDRIVSNGLVAFISSPGTESSTSLFTASSTTQSDDYLLTLQDNKDTASTLVISCRGSSLCATSLPERTSLATTSLVSNVLVLEGITAGDLERGLKNSRHARTLTALFRARLHSSTTATTTSSSGKQHQQQQALILSLPAIVTPTDNEGDDESESEEEQIKTNAQVAAMLESVKDEIKAVYEAVLAERNERVAFDSLYQLHLIQGATSEKVLALAAQEAAALTAVPVKDEAATTEETPTTEDTTETTDKGTTTTPEEPAAPLTLVSLLSQAYQQARQSPDLLVAALDPPLMAQSYLKIRQSYAQQAKTVRATLAAWKAQVARGGWVQGFGLQAEQLRSRTVQRFVQETRDALGWSATSSTTASSSSNSNSEAFTTLPRYRVELQQQLVALVDSAIREVFQGQVTNLEKSTLKKLQDQLMTTTEASTSPTTTATTTTTSADAPDGSKAAMRSVALSFDIIMDTLEVPSLGLTKAKASRAMSSKLSDAVEAFPSSPRMQLKRLNQVQKTTRKQRKPQERAVDVGLDLVAMLRPDGFGSFQGFCGYQLGGNSVTVGVHNDADDPQVISQFGGVRPPLLRVQPKLRLDVEL